LKDYLLECPGDFRLDGPLVADDLVTAFRIGHWWADVGEHGDIVGLTYAGDDHPPESEDDFPISIFGTLAPFVRYGSFLRQIEGDAALMWHRLGRGENVYYRREPGVRLRQLGEPPVVRPGESAIVDFHLDGYGTYDAVEIGCSHSTQVSYEFEDRRVEIGRTARVRVTVRPGAADPVALYVCMSVHGVDQFDGTIVVRADTSADEADAIREVIATESPLDQGFQYPAVRATDLPEAHEALRRYAVRHADRPGAEFLRGVLDAPDIRSALRAAELETGYSDTGDLLGLRFAGARLPGYERYLWGLFASLRGIVQQDPWFKIAYADDPAHWVRFAYDWNEPSRDLWER
jgi:hypothetical protein